MRRVLCLVCLAVLLGMGAGCATKAVTPKDWMAVSGSRHDGIVVLAYTWNPQIEIPSISEEQAIELASEKCRAWGYIKAEPFGSHKTRCTDSRVLMFGDVVCLHKEAEAVFQCINNVEPEDIEK